MSTLSFSEGLNALFRERRQEFIMYHVIGWTKGKILKHILKESIVWFTAAGIIGALASGFILFLINISTVWIIIGLSIGFILMSVILCLVLLSKGIETRW
jgi:putative ABC transport system permease protein